MYRFIHCIFLINRFKFKLYNSFTTEDGISMSKHVKKLKMLFYIFKLIKIRMIKIINVIIIIIIINVITNNK